jgi:ring-1,2-phenylacetyl-CoA epoxidase subunit PaaD
VTTPTEALTRRVWGELARVPDPEIPALSVVDLGIVHRVEAGEGTIRVQLLPTFVGCPAVELMRSAVAERLAPLAGRVEVEVTFAPPWTSDRISAEGRRKLRESGFAPPALQAAEDRPLFETIRVRPAARGAVCCPWCGSRETRMDNPFGPTLCRAIHFCTACRQPFEEFKPV